MSDKYKYNSWPLGKVPKELQRPELDELKNMGYEFSDPRDVVDIFEEKVAKFAGSKYAVSVDCCSHGLFLSLKYLESIGETLKNIESIKYNFGEITIPKRTYVSTPMQINQAGYTVNFDDGESLDFSTWVFEVSVSEGVDLTEYFNVDSGDFGDYFNVSVMRAGGLTTISNLEPLYYVDTKITVSFNDGSNPLEFTFNIVVNTIDPVFTKYDLPDESLGLEVDTNGHDYFNEGDTITFSNWSFSVTLMSGTPVSMNHDDVVYLTIYDPGTLDESVFGVLVEFQVFDIYMSSNVGIYVEPDYVPDYSIIIATLPDKLVFFVGDEIDFDGLVITVEDYGTPLENIENEALSFYGDSDGIDNLNQVVEGSFFSSDSSIIDNGKIWIEYQADDGNYFTDFFKKVFGSNFPASIYFTALIYAHEASFWLLNVAM
jgi:hypothetical protein